MSSFANRALWPNYTTNLTASSKLLNLMDASSSEMPLFKDCPLRDEGSIVIQNFLGSVLGTTPIDEGQKLTKGGGGEANGPAI